MKQNLHRQKHINMCMPNQAYSVEELLQRSLNGQPLPSKIGSPDPFGKYDDMANQARITDISQVLESNKIANNFINKALEFEKREREKESERINLLKQYQDEHNERQENERRAYVEYQRRQRTNSLDSVAHVSQSVVD